MTLLALALALAAAAPPAGAAGQYTAPAPNSTSGWISPVLDFPERGLAPGELAVVSLEITVNPRGGMAGCTGTVSLGNPNMGPYTCGILKNRTEFDAARDPSGRRMWGVYRQTVNWWNPGERGAVPPAHASPAEFELDVGTLPPKKGYPLAEIQFAVDAAGNGSSCSATAEETNHDFAVIACDRLEGKLKAPPARDRKGRAVPSVQTARVRFVVRAPGG